MKRLLAMCVNQHNRIQFLGYELANVALVAQAFLSGRQIDNRTFLETCAALALLIGSVCIWKYHPLHRSTMLFYGGVFLTFGGVFLTFAGYPVTGLSVTLASLETTRGGVLAIVDHCKSAITRKAKVAVFTRKTLLGAVKAFGWYIRTVRRLTLRFKKFGQFIDTRPFLSGALIKAPLRLEFVVKNILAGDVVGVGVGLSWMVLGDGGLALNDEQLKRRLLDYSAS